MNKKIILCLLVLLITFTFVGCKKEEEVPPESPPTVKTRLLIELDEYKDLKVEDIVSLDIIKYTEGGDQRETVTDQEEINNVFNTLSNTKIGEETQRTCEDNTTVYRFTTKDGKNYSIEFECSWLVLGNKRYNIVK